MPTERPSSARRQSGAAVSAKPAGRGRRGSVRVGAKAAAAAAAPPAAGVPVADAGATGAAGAGAAGSVAHIRAIYSGARATIQHEGWSKLETRDTRTMLKSTLAAVAESAARVVKTEKTANLFRFAAASAAERREAVKSEMEDIRGQLRHGADFDAMREQILGLMDKLFPDDSAEKQQLLKSFEAAAVEFHTLNTKLEALKRRGADAAADILQLQSQMHRQSFDVNRWNALFNDTSSRCSSGGNEPAKADRKTPLHLVKGKMMELHTSVRAACQATRAARRLSLAVAHDEVIDDEVQGDFNATLLAAVARCGLGAGSASEQASSASESGEEECSQAGRPTAAGPSLSVLARCARVLRGRTREFGARREAEEEAAVQRWADWPETVRGSALLGGSRPLSSDSLPLSQALAGGGDARAPGTRRMSLFSSSVVVMAVKPRGARTPTASGGRCKVSSAGAAAAARASPAGLQAWQSRLAAGSPAGAPRAKRRPRAFAAEAEEDAVRDEFGVWSDILPGDLAAVLGQCGSQSGLGRPSPSRGEEQGVLEAVLAERRRRDFAAAHGKAGVALMAAGSEPQALKLSAIVPAPPGAPPLRRARPFGLRWKEEEALSQPDELLWCCRDGPGLRASTPSLGLPPSPSAASAPPAALPASHDDRPSTSPGHLSTPAWRRRLVTVEDDQEPARPPTAPSGQRRRLGQRAAPAASPRPRAALGPPVSPPAEGRRLPALRAAPRSAHGWGLSTS